MGPVGVVRSGATPPGRSSSTARCGGRAVDSPRRDDEALHEGDPVVVERVRGLTLSVRRADDWELFA